MGGTNIRTGETFPILRGRDGTWHTFHGQCDPIGMVKMWSGISTTIPAGWTIDTSFDNRFPRGDTDDTHAAAGSNTHTHADTGTKSTGLAVVDPATGTSEHVEHFHNYTGSPIQVNFGAGFNAEGISSVNCTSGARNTACVTGQELDHQVNETAHDHTVPDGANVPEYQEIYFIKRTS